MTFDTFVNLNGDLVSIEKLAGKHAPPKAPKVPLKRVECKDEELLKG